ncbi:unnamed protein product [Trichobilharzia szidati]|nr:unnamed protein product [Trichobilharzia szidati]
MMKNVKNFCSFNGIQTVKEIVWEDWIPGRSYTKLLKLHNVDKLSKTCTFSIPSCGVFSSVHPEIFKVPPGTTISLPVTFRPTKLTELCQEISLNLSVDGSVKIEPVSGNTSFQENTIFCTLSEVITIPAQSSSRISFTYTPRIPKTSDVGYFKISQLNGCNETIVKCVDVNVQLSTNHCTFPITQVDELKSHTICITNYTDYPTVYELKAGHSQIYMNENNETRQLISTVFPILKGSCNGVIKPRETIKLVIGFYPHIPGHFYRRYVLFVCDQEPQFLHLLGTCHDLYERPHHLTVKHLAAVNSDHEKLTDETMKCSGNLKGHKNGYEIYSEMMQSSEIMINPPLVSLNCSTWNFTSNLNLLAEAISCAEQLNKSINQGLEINTDHLAIRNTLIVQNHTNDALIIHWSPSRHLPGETSHQMNSNKQTIDKVVSVFKIEPICKELAPNSSTEFTILFTPANLCQYYHQEFEGYAMYKKQRDSSLLSLELIKPPHCLMVNCFGHTFPNNKQPFMPSYEVSKPKIIFDSIEYCENKYDSVSVYNKSEYPLFLQHTDCIQFFNSDNISKEILNIRLIPSVSLIPPNAYKVIVFQCEVYLSLTEIQQKMSLRKNEINLKALELISMNQRPEYELKMPIDINLTTAVVDLDCNGELYFIPTHVGSHTEKEFKITNASPYEIEFRWEITSDDRNEIGVNPNKGILLPYEIQSQIWSFHPKQITSRIFKPRLIYWRSSESNHREQSEVKQQNLRVITMSDRIQLSADPQTITCQSILVNTSEKYQIKFHNSSLVSSNFCIIIKPITSDHENISALNDFITVDPMDNKISGRSTKTVTIHICPKARGSFCFQVYYRLYTIGNNDQISQQQEDTMVMKADTKRKYLTEEVLAVTIFVEAVYPTLRITDIHGSGSLSRISPVELWRSLDIDSLNISLENDPTENELKDTINTRPLYRDHPKAMNTRGPEFDLLIGTSTVKKIDDEINPSKAVLCLLVENSSLIDVEFAFLFPEDLRVELPSWAENGHYEDIELQFMHIENHSLFEIHPKRQLLKPGEYCEIMITYKHNLLGCHQLPVLLKINRGREVKLNLIGITLPSSQPYLQLSDRKYVFAPIPVGLGDFRLGYLFQMKLRNPSSRPIHFRVSHLEWTADSKTSNTSVVKQEMCNKYLEYDIPILHCVQNQGLIEPNGLYTLNWRFQPIEAKTYSAYCYIHITDAEKTLVEDTDRQAYSDTILLELIAIGYDPQQFGPKEVLANPQRVRIPTAIENHIIPTDRRSNSLSKFNGDEDHSNNDLTFRNFPPLSRRIKQPIDSWVSLSHHLLDLQRIVVGTRCRRLIHMTNRFSIDNNAQISRLPVINRSVYRFRWFTEFSEDMENIIITPRLGRIKPGQTIQVLITYTATGLPSFTETNLICELIDESEENKYYQEMKAWQSELDRLKVEFTITEKDILLANTMNEISKTKSGRANLLPSESSEVDIEKFCQKWPKPICSKPAYVYLTINAEIINEEAAKVYGINSNEEEKTKFTDYTIFLNSNHSAAKSLSLSRVEDAVWQVHRQLFIDLLTSLLADLIYNDEFVQTIQKVVVPPDTVIDKTDRQCDNNQSLDDPIPLWMQIKTDNCCRINDTEGEHESLDNRQKNRRNEGDLQLQDLIPEIVKELNNKQDMKSMYEENADNMCMQNPVFQSIVEDCLAGIIRNIMDEVNEREFEITTRPRIIALPPRRTE